MQAVAQSLGAIARQESILSEIQLLTTFDQIESVSKAWERLQWHPNADADFFRLITEGRKEIKGPCVLALREGEQVKALLAGRVRSSHLSDLPGLPAAIQPRLKVLEVIYGGMMGDWSGENLDRLLLFLKASLADGLWHAVRFRMLNLQSPLWERSRSYFRRICRGSVAAPNLHWSLRLSKSYEEFYRALDGKIRKNLNRQRKRLETDFSEVSVSHFDRIEDLDRITVTTDAVVSKTYQKGLEKDWRGEEMTKRVGLWLSRGQLMACFLYLNGRACAYQHVLKYQGRAFGAGTAYDPGFQRYGIGRFIQLKALEKLYEHRDVAEFDFGFGDAEYKRELCNRHWEEADLVLFGASRAGLLANAMRTAETAAIRLGTRLLKSAGMFGWAKDAWRESRRKTHGKG